MTIDADLPFAAAAFRSRVEHALADTDPIRHDHGDHVLNPDFQRANGAPLTDAAVLVPVIDRPGEASVLLTQRTEMLSSHKGQVAFPGGKIDTGDASPEAAALREAHEEVGLDARHISVAGRFEDYVSGSGYRIKPVIGIVHPGFDLTINHHEVADVFEVPLSFLMDERNYSVESLFWNERERFFYHIAFADGGRERKIWGVTAGIIRAIYERLYT